MTMFGGETSLADFVGVITVEPHDACTAAAPILPGQLFKLAIAGDTAADGSGWKLIPAAENDDPTTCELVEALERCIGTQLSVVRLCVPGQTRTLSYKSGAAPTVGQSIAVSSELTSVKGDTWARGQGTVMAVDTTTLTCEVLF